MKITFIFSIIILLTLSFRIRTNITLPPIKTTKQDSTTNLNYQIYQFGHSGYRRFLSSWLWVATIIQSDEEHYKTRDLNSWMFHRFYTISILEPKFYENYKFGALYLSVVKDDIPGASIMYEKGMQEYPEDFNLWYDAGFHFRFEAKNLDKARAIYQKLKEIPSNKHMVYTSLAKLEALNGNFKVAYEIAREQYEKYKDNNSFLAAKFYNYMEEFKAKIKEGE